LDLPRPFYLIINKKEGNRMIYFLGVIFLLFTAGIVYLAFKKPEKLTKKQRDSVRKKSGRLRW
jgi:preprotein translocase subunit SecG